MSTFEAICIGDELLDGRVRDANAAAFGEFLALRGQSLSYVQFVRDDIDHICAGLRATTADVVVVTGGLGPTTDDRTREAAAAFSETELVFDEASFAAIRARFAERGREITSNNRRQAMFPAAATPLATSVGTAPGFTLQLGARLVFFFPGVPREFRWFLQEYVAPHVSGGGARRALHFHGLGESTLETTISDVVDPAAKAGLIVGYRADYPVIELKLAGPPELVDRTATAVLERLGPWYVGEADDPLPARVGRLLLERGETVTTAESCTAGGIAALITEVSGSSAWFGRGYVTYANEAKVDEVGVLETTLLQHGAVSAQTVCQMAAGARRRSRATYAVAVSGIAGPSGGTPEKPVGTVHFGLATPRGTFHRHVHYRLGDRALVRAGTAYSALAMLLWVLEDRLGDHDVDGPWSDEQVWASGGIDREAR